ncbi:helix-turn-helix domain-containing protein, partial [Akkermansiaceae bacterium]|nr:helix-turn-helix domain-containing protein [Akkermansiaceae bacterium]
VRGTETGIFLVWFYNKLTMNEKYHRLCAENRKTIYNMDEADFSQTEIGRAIGFSQSARS